MHSLGNDFVVLDGVRQSLNIAPSLARHIADRKRGIGCDQILVAESDPDDDIDFMFRIYNPDGSESGQCGNGARCFAKYLFDNNLTDKSDIVVNTSSHTRMTLSRNLDDSVTVDMGRPRFEPGEIPFAANQTQPTYSIPLDNTALEFSILSMGNPHAVLLVDDVSSAEVDKIGSQVECHPLFPERTNVGFMQIENSKRIKLRVYERGTGETQACGSGACAAVVSGRQLGLLEENVEVNLPGGRLQVNYAGGARTVFLRGDAVHVYDGQIDHTN